jgi:hypothetical protein
MKWNEIDYTYLSCLPTQTPCYSPWVHMEVAISTGYVWSHYRVMYLNGQYLAGSLTYCIVGKSLMNNNE